MSSYALRKKLKAAKTKAEKTHILAEILIPEQREEGFTHVKLAAGDCGSEETWAISDYEQHLAKHSECVRRVRTWLKGREGRG